jgi:general secretion pathway protein D
MSPQKTSSSIIDGVTLAWQGPQQVRSGEQFSTVLRMQSGQSINGVAGLVAFDPAHVQVVGVAEGDFFGKGGAQTNFSSRVDPVSGKVFLVAIRQGGAINGAGTLATVTFKAVQSTPQTAIQVLSMTPEPEGSVAPIPLEHVLSVN